MSRFIKRVGGIPTLPQMKRGGTLGALDHEMNVGPTVLDPRDVPADLLPRYVHAGQFAPGAGEGGSFDFSNLQRIADDVNAIASTLRLDRGLLGRVVTVTNTPQLIAQAQYARAYLFLNPAGATGLTTTGTLISSNTAAGATTVTSGALGVANYKSARFFVIATFDAGAGPVTFDLQTADPVTGTYITTQTIWSLTATGNDYAFIDQLGVDTDLKMLVTVPAGTTITFSVGYVLKDGLEGTSAGAIQTIYLGGAGVSPVSGYPLLNGKERAFYFNQNTQLYAVTNGPSLDMNVFEL